MEQISSILKRAIASPLTNIPQENTQTLSSDEIKCKICRDSKFVHPVANGRVDYGRIVDCKCVAEENRVKRIKAMIKYCDFPPMAKDFTFENFNAYSPNLKKALNIARGIAQKTNELAWVTFGGGNGTGKTHLAIAICKEWIKRGVTAKYAFTPLLLDELREGFSKKGDDSYSEKFKTLCEVSLLVLDDLGAESSTAWVQEKLETLVDYRYMNNLSLIVTTNKAMDELTPRLASRLIRHPKATPFYIDAKEYVLVKKDAG